MLCGFHLARELSGLRPTAIRYYISNTQESLEHVSEDFPTGGHLLAGLLHPVGQPETAYEWELKTAFG